MATIRPKAQALIQSRYVDKGATTRIVVAPMPGSGLPEDLVEAGLPVTLDLLSGRPVNLALGEEGLGADFCFGGPPVRCQLPWSAVLAVQSEAGDGMEQTVAVTVALRMEDDSLLSVAEVPAGDSPRPPPAPSRIPGASFLRVVK